MKKILMMMFAALVTMNVLADDVNFQVKNMRCENCAKRIEKVLKGSEGVSEVQVCLEQKTVSVSFDAQKTTTEALQKALADARFEAEVAKAGGCKHDGKQCGHKCGEKKGEKDQKHECGGEGCGHHGEKTAE